MSELDLTKIAQREWEPLGPQTSIEGFRLYRAPDGDVSGVYEDVEITDEMAERAWDAYCEARDNGEDEPVVVMRAAVSAALNRKDEGECRR